MDDLTVLGMDPPGLGEANHLGSDALQDIQIKVLCSEKGEGNRQQPFGFLFLGENQIPSVSKKPVKSLEKIFDCTRAVNQELEEWLAVTDKYFYQGNSKPGYTSMA